MKKLGLFALAMALVMTLSQCKKDDTTTPTNDGKKVPITLKVSSNGAKHEVTPSTGEVAFEDGDVLHVASNGVYLGTLEYNNSVFSGEINTPTEGLPLHFYFLGNVTPEFNPNNTECSVVISDQTTNLPVISYNTSKENYETGKTNYNARLLNQCALVKFEVTSSVPNSATSIMGMNNRVTVTFGSDEFGYDQVNDGKITLPAGEGERWAILLPQNEVARAVVRSADEMWEGSCGTIPAIAINDYLTNGIAAAISHPTGAINSLFSVSTTQQVYFSKGNLQYQASTNTWRFATNQYDYVGSDNSNISSSYSGWIDLFGWGTSGYSHGAACYQPWSTSTEYTDYKPYNNGSGNLYDNPGTADWGYNAISNGGNTENSGWYTLDSGGWYHVLQSRNASTVNGIPNARYTLATVNGVAGLILFPDVYTHPSNVTPPHSINLSNNFEANNYSADDWTAMENAGCVFLPAAGYRDGTGVSELGSYLFYWSSTGGGYSYSFYYGYQTTYSMVANPTLNTYMYDNSRARGGSVRLVRNAN